MIRSLKKNITLDFVMCLLLIVASGNPIFIYSTYVRELYIILVILSFLYSKKRNIYIAKDYISYISVFIIILSYFGLKPKGSSLLYHTKIIILCQNHDILLSFFNCLSFSIELLLNYTACLKRRYHIITLNHYVTNMHFHNLHTSIQQRTQSKLNLHEVIGH